MYRVLNDAEQAEVERREEEAIIRSAYDTLFGYLQSVHDVYARACLVRHLDRLYETALSTVPDSPSQLAETADLHTTSPARPSSASTATSGIASGSSTDKDLPENSF